MNQKIVENIIKKLDLELKAGVSGVTALHMCAEARDVETAELWLELGSDSTCSDRLKYSTRLRNRLKNEMFRLTRIGSRLCQETLPHR